VRSRPDAGAVRALVVIVGTLVVIGGIATAAYLAHSSVRESQLIERDYRALATASDQLRDRLDGLREALGTEARSPASVDRQTLPRSPAATALSSVAVRDVAAESCPKPLPGADWIECIRTSHLTSAASAHGTRMAIELAYDRRSFDAYVAYDPSCDTLLDLNAVIDATACAMPAPCTMDSARRRRCGRIPLAPIIGDTLPNAALFDAVIVTVGDEAQVLHGTLRAEPSEIAAKLKSGAAPAKPPSETMQNEATRAGQDPAQAGKNARVPVVTIQGNDYKQFSQPVAVSPFATTAGSQRLQLHGLVRTSSFDRETRHIDDSWVLTMLLVLAVAVLTWPVLKVGLMGPAERLSGFDVRVLTLAMLVLTGVVALTILQLGWRLTLDDAFDRQLFELQSAVDTTFHEDIAGAMDALAAAERGSSKPVAFGDFALIAVIEPRLAQPSKWWTPAATSGGWKLEPREKEKPLKLTVSDRQYYADVLAHHLPFFGKTAAGEMVRSKTSGALSLVLARPLLGVGTIETPPIDDSGERVILIGVNATRFLRATVPYGFGFAIIDVDGRVQMHSDSRRVLVENLLDQCERAPELVASLDVGGTPSPVEVECGGAVHRMLASDIADTPWKLVVFRDETLVEKISDETIAIWAALFLSYVAALVAVLLTAQIINDGYRAEWAWPDRRDPRIYLTAIPRLLATAAVLAAAIDHQAGLARLGFLTAATLATIAALALSLAAPRVAEGRPVLDPVERRTSICVLSLALLALLIFAVVANDLETILALVALALVWRTIPRDAEGARARLIRPSQSAMLALLGAYAVLSGLNVGTWARMAVLGSVLAIAALAELARRFPSLAPFRDRALAALGPAATWVATGWAHMEWRGENDFRRRYVGMLAGLLVVVALVPAVVLYGDARAYVWAAQVRFGRSQLDATRVRQRARAVAEHPGTGRSSDADRNGYLGYVDRAVYTTAWTRWNETPVPSLFGVSGPGIAWAARDDHSVARLLAGDTIPWLPGFGEPVPALRALMATRRASEDTPRAGSTGESAPARVLTSLVMVVGLALVAAFMMFFLVWSIVRLIFLLDADRVPDGQPLASDATAPRGALNVWQFTGTGGSARVIAKESKPEERIIDVRMPTEPKELIDAATKIAADQTVTFVEIDHPASVYDDVELHRALLTALEHLVHGGTQTIVLTTDVDPLHWASARAIEVTEHSDQPSGAPAADHTKAGAVMVDPAKSAAEFLARWSRLLAGFTRAPWRVPNPKASGTDRDTTDALATKYPSLSADENDENVDAPRHWEIWRQCTRAEKLVLRQLAHEGFLNPNSASVVRRLAERLLVRRDPAFSLVSRSFEQFVLRAETPETIGAWERAGAPSAWARLRLPFAAMATIAAVYLVIVQPDTLNYSIAVTTAVAAALPALMKVFSFIGEQRTGNPGR
jgi:hypothetical protein